MPRKQLSEKLIDKVQAFAESLRKEQEFLNFNFRIDRDGRGSFHSITVRAPKDETLKKKSGDTKV